jgi:hypothetical protein
MKKSNHLTKKLIMSKKFRLEINGEVIADGDEKFNIFISDPEGLIWMKGDYTAEGLMNIIQVGMLGSAGPSL